MLNFNMVNATVDYTYANTEYEQEINAYSGYYSVFGDTELWVGATSFEAISYYEVYSYAVGSLVDGGLSITFDAFLDTPIILTKA